MLMARRSSSETSVFPAPPPELAALLACWVFIKLQTYFSISVSVILRQWRLSSVCFEQSFIENSRFINSRTKSLSRFLLSLSMNWRTLSNVAELAIRFFPLESLLSVLLLNMEISSSGAAAAENEELSAKSLILPYSTSSYRVKVSKMSSINGRE